MSSTPRSAAHRLERYAEQLERALAWLIVGLMVAMVADVSWQVVSRFLLRAPSSFTEELAGFLLIWIGLLGAAYALRTRAHLGIDLLTERLTGAGKCAAAILAHTLVLLFAFTVMVVGGLRLVQLAFQLNQISAAMGLRMGYVYLALPLAGLLMVVFSLESIVTVAARRAER
ncbi:MAG: TRAP transporter small permease [Gemmatimonadales bacterium]|jgi:TRAP-type C4-dicarboxylate transport system permease small subunit